jgi:predicted membrane-bound spermidine synthase
MLFREITVVYSENHIKPILTKLRDAELLIVQAGETYSYHRALKG